MKPRDLLAKVPIFADLSPLDLQRLGSVCRERIFPGDTDIVEVGDPGHSLFLILAGEVQVLFPARSDDFELARLGPGDFFGEMAVLNDRPRSATIRSLDEVRTLALSKEDFQRVLLEQPTAAVKLLEVLSSRLRNTDEQISGLTDISLQDDLTGLLNPRAFQARLMNECDRIERYGGELTLLFAELHDLELLHDILSNAVVSWVGRLLEEHTRRSDVAFRVRHGRFAVLFPNTGIATGRAASERLLRIVSEARPAIDLPRPISIAGGLAACPTHGSTASELQQRGRAALARARSPGGERLVVAEGAS